ncbi:hypothetical protein G6F43_000506 [Rhizopus delemar]|nr:hypothetical protein G6F43_000506 [Rhizopus delemar]
MLFTTKIQVFVLLLISFILVYYILPTHHNTTTVYNFTNLNQPSGDRVLILTPFKQSAHLIDRYFDNLERLTYPHHLVSVGLLVSDSTDGTLDKIQARVDKQLPFEEITVMQRDFHYDLPNNEDRHRFDVQVQRRAIMAKSRNTLLATTLSSKHDWVLWLDGDVTEYPETILEELIAVNKDVVAPNCWWHSYNEEGGYDKNNWQETPESLEFKKSLSEDDVLVEGYENVLLTHRKLMMDMRNESGDIYDTIPLDAVGGTCTFVKAQVHRDGAIFPPFVYQHQVETEGFAKMTLEINWHEGQAIYSIDFSLDGLRYATAGADSSIRIWSIQKRPDNAHEENSTRQEKDKSKQLVNSLPVDIDFLSELKRHSSPVNVVRFSPKGDYLASAGDAPSKENTMINDHSEYEKETWSVVHMFYGHNKEIYDLAWSPCGRYFITASIDNTARVWSLIERNCIHVIADHSHYVQGVSWDPLGQYVSTQSSDRSVAIYKYRKTNNDKITFTPCVRKFTKIDKGKEPFRLYHDENLVSFFRRLSFSPDGALLITPAGLNRSQDEEGEQQEEQDLQNCAYIYPRNMLLKQPVGLVGNHPKPSIAIRWCPTLFKKRSNFPSAFALPYRMLYATATQDSVYIYDTQQIRPICAISGMHFAPITDLAWSPDGAVLMFSSADGYCSAVVFSEGEMGIRYEKQIERSTEDIEMTEAIPKKRIIDSLKSQQQESNSNNGNSKKRRITPMLVSSSS